MLLENEVCGTTTSKLCTTDATICRLAVACLLGFCRIKPIVIGCHGSDSNIRLTLMAPITFGSELKLDWPFLEHINSWAHKSCICKYNAGNEIIITQIYSVSYGFVQDRQYFRPDSMKMCTRWNKRAEQPREMSGQTLSVTQSTPSKSKQTQKAALHSSIH